MSRVNSIRFSLPYLQKKKKRAFGDLSWLHTYMNKSKFLHFELCWCPRGAWQEHFLWCLAAMQCFTKAYRGCRPLAVTFFTFFLLLNSTGLNRRIACMVLCHGSLQKRRGVFLHNCTFCEYTHAVSSLFLGTGHTLKDFIVDLPLHASIIL